MDVVLLIGRILFAAIFFISALGHFKQTDGMAQYAQAKGVPNARQGVLVSGAIALAGSIMIVLGLWTDLGALLLIVFLLPVTFMMHPFWKVSDPQARQAEQINFHKNISLLGGAVILFWLAHEGVHLPLSLTDSLF